MNYEIELDDIIQRNGLPVNKMIIKDDDEERVIQYAPSNKGKKPFTLTTTNAGAIGINDQETNLSYHFNQKEQAWTPIGKGGKRSLGEFLEIMINQKTEPSSYSWESAKELVQNSLGGFVPKLKAQSIGNPLDADVQYQYNLFDHSGVKSLALQYHKDDSGLRNNKISLVNLKTNIKFELNDALNRNVETTFNKIKPFVQEALKP